VGALARILMILLKQDSILAQMAEQAPQFVSTEFDLTRCTGRLEILYDKFCFGSQKSKDMKDDIR
jgi:hypothetical protein